MQTFRRAIATFSMVAILSTLVVTATASAGTYPDVKADHWAYSYVEDLVELGVFDGKGNFNPAEDMNRATFVKTVVEAAGLEGTTEIKFPDVKATDWFYPYVATAVANGVISGYKNGNFGPADKLTREQAAKIVVEAFDLPLVEPATPTFKDVPKTAWSYGYVETLASYGIVSGYKNGNFGPGDNVKREQVAKIVAVSVNPEPIEDPVNPEPVVPEPVEDDMAVPTGDLTVSLNTDTPAGDTVPSNASSVPVAMWDFKAEGGDVTLSSLEVHTSGVTSLPTTHALYLYDGVDRLTSGKSVNSSTNTATFNALNLTIDKGETKTLTLKVDVGDAGTTSREMTFELESAEAVNAGDSTVGGEFPATAEKFGISTTDAGTVTIEKNGVITNPKVGEDDVVVAKFKIGAASEAASIEQLNLLVTGTVSNDAVENFELYVSGTDTPIATVESLNTKDLAAFVLDPPYEIAKGETKSFTMKADFNTGRTSDTVFIYVDEVTDLVAIGGTYGYGMQVVTNTATTGYDGVTTACSATAGTCSYSTLQGGDITISSNGPTATSVGIGADDVVLMNFSVVSVSNVTFKDFPVAFTASEADATEGLLNSTAANFTDIKITNVDTNETLMGPVDADVLTTALAGATAITEAANNDNAIAYYLFTDEFDMAAGEELNLALTADVANTATLDAMTIYSTLDLGNTSNAYPIIKDVNNKTVTNTTSLIPTSDITGKTMTVGSPTLTLALAAVPVSTTHVKGAQDVRFTGISAKCSTASTCNITDVLLQGYIDDDGAANSWSITGTGSDNSTALNTYVGSVWLEDADGNVIAESQSVESDGDVSFDDVNWELDAGETTIFYVVGKISSNAYANSNGENIAFGVATAGDVDFEDDDGTARESTGTPNNQGTGVTDPSTFVTVSSGGSLTVSVDSGTPKETIILAGTSNNQVSKFKFTTTDEPFLVKALSINVKQANATATSDVAATDIGAYDNNISAVKLTYTNSAGDEETKSGYLTGGTAQFSGMDMYIDKNDDEVLTVSVDANTISNGAQAGEFIEANIAYNNFEAVAQSSGDTYKADKIDATVAATSDLDFGTITYTSTGVAPGAADTTMTLGAVETFVTADLNVTLPVGTIVLFDDNGTWDAAESDIIILTTQYTDGDLTITGILADLSDEEIDAGETVYFSLPGHGYSTDTKQMHVYETKPTVTLSTSSPSGSRSVATSDSALVFDIKAGDSEKVQIRTGKSLPTCVIGFDVGNDGDQTVAGTSTTAAIDGSDCLLTQVASSAAGDSISFDAGATSVLETYSRVSFWMQMDVIAQFADIEYGVDAAAGAGADGTVDHKTALSAGDCTIAETASSDDTVANTWYHCDVAMNSSVSTDHDRYFHIVTAEITQLANTKKLYIDQVVLYNDKLTLDIEGDDIGTYAEIRTSAILGTLPVYLKDGGTTLATGYLYKNTSAATEGGTSSVTFVPIDGTDSTIEISKGDTRTFTVNLSTSALLDEDAGADDPLTFSFDLGTASNGTVTAGDFWWNDSNFSSSTAGSEPGTAYALTTPGIIKWLGAVTSTKFTGNTVKY